MANQPHDRLTPGSISAAAAPGKRKRLALWLGSAALMMPGAALAIPPGGYSGLQASPTPTPTATPTPKPKPKTPPPTSILPASMQPATPRPTATLQKPAAQPAPYIDAQPTTAPVAPPPVLTPGAPNTRTVTTIVPAEQPVRTWTLADAQSLLAVIKTIDTEGLFPGDYKPEVLAAAITAGAGPALDEAASRSFDWLAEDLRDGRTPMDSRIQWFAVDTDVDAHPTHEILERALATHDVAGVLAGLDPTYADYAALKDALAATPRADKARRDMIRINMDRWRWLPRELGQVYLLTNIPEFQLRFNVGGKIIKTYRTVVGKPGRTATPQLAEKVQAVVFNPTWTVPQSIVKGENLGAKLLANPASAARQGYKVTKSESGMITVVQQPGDKNSLGRMKIDMPNPHAIYLHDTPAKALFETPVRAYSHGCIRTQDALKLGMTIAMVRGDMTQDEASELYHSLKYKRVVMKQATPVYLTYTTMGLNVEGQMSTFKDIYDRDAPVLASFRGPRALHTTQRTSTQEVIVADDPL
ncbi:L,D-transpeptidase family protein [Novosphingobium terrae]|uniref:L,D-transpeptidase family protein n=1 Tax=Novosphingobium terrae TaxID=2726189 RepID=UPI001F13BEB4|nr:L,D-transpeptidase family protein [Novosphingobium terrae]